MRRLAILLAGAALLAGCAAPAVPEAASAVQAVSSEAGTGHAGSRTEQLAVLDGLVDPRAWRRISPVWSWAVCQIS